MPEPRPRARFEQSNTRSHGEIVEVSGYNVYTMEMGYSGYPRQSPLTKQKMWWCCCCTTQIELLDDNQQVELKPTSNL